MIYTATSSFFSLFVNLRIEYILIPWRIIFDLSNQTITIEQRNWCLIGKNSTTMAFRFIRNVEVNEHIVGADISIKVFGSTVTACHIVKKDAKQIREILINFNQKK